MSARRKPMRLAGIEAALAGQPRVRRWLAVELRSTRPYRLIIAELRRRHGIRTSGTSLSEYLRRHEAEIFGRRKATAHTLTTGKWLLTITAPGASRIRARFSPVPRGAPPSRHGEAQGFQTQMKPIRPEPIYIEREDGSAYRLDPPTRAQVRACLALDPSGDVEETPLEIDARVSAQLRALVGDGAARVDAATRQPIAGAPPRPRDELSSDEEQQLIWALMARHLGHDPAHAVATQQALGKVFAPRIARGESNATTPTASPSPSTCEPTPPPQIECPS